MDQENLKGGIGSLFDPCIKAMGQRADIETVDYGGELLYIPPDLARSFGCAHNHYCLIRRTITYVRA